MNFTETIQDILHIGERDNIDFDVLYISKGTIYELGKGSLTF